MKPTRAFRIAVLAAAVALAGGAALAGTIQATVSDGGKPIGDAVVFAAPAGGDAYAGEIAFADAQIGRLLDAIRRRWGWDGQVDRCLSGPAALT